MNTRPLTSSKKLPRSSAFSTRLSGAEKQANELREVYIKVVTEQLPVVLESLREYTRTMVRMYDKQGKQAAGNISQLIEPQGGTFEVANASLISSRDVKILIVLLVLTAFASLFYSLMMGITRQRKQN